jgi:hypothetical protein
VNDSRNAYVLVVIALTLFGCDLSSDLPGDALGSYSVTGALTSNSCGSGVGADKSVSFSVDLSLDGDTLYLEQIGSDDTEIATGDVDSDDGTTASLSNVLTTNVKDAYGNVGPCNLTISTTYDLVLNDASASKSFRGTATFEYAAATSVSSTTNCTSQLASEGGKYATLPCRVEYDLAATRD